MEVNLYRYIGGYGDGILIIIPDKLPIDLGFLNSWGYLGKYDLPESLLKALGWDGKKEYIEIFYIE